MSYLGDYIPLETEIIIAMTKSANMSDTTKYIHLGCGEGQFLEKAIEFGVKAENVFGVEVDVGLYNICIRKGLNVINDDCFNLNYLDYDVVMFWFELNNDLILLMNKLYKELKIGGKVICMHSNRKQYRDGAYVPEESYPMIPCNWLPKIQEISEKRFYLYVR